MKKKGFKKRPTSKGIQLKKKFGQHFLREDKYIWEMLDAVQLDSETSVFEVGCGDGFLTRHILQTDIARLWIFEIDHDWVVHIEKEIQDDRMTVKEVNILDVDFSLFDSHKPWTLLSNLPYQITFPFLHRLQENRQMLKEGVIMIQEEVAEKILKTYGRGYGYSSLFFQHYFEWKKLLKVPPSAFYPPPKIFSRLLYFKPRENITPIPDEKEFWKFIKLCFKQPRRTLENNLIQTHYDVAKIPDKYSGLRSQQLSMNDLLHLWDNLRD